MGAKGREVEAEGGRGAKGRKVGIRYPLSTPSSKEVRAQLV